MDCYLQDSDWYYKQEPVLLLFFKYKWYYNQEPVYGIRYTDIRPQLGKNIII